MTASTLRELEAFPDRLAACFAEFPAELRHWKPESWDGIPSERLTAIAQIVEFRQARARTLGLVKNLPKVQWQRGAVFENRPTSLCGLLHFLSSHDQQHLAGLQWLLARMQHDSW